MNDGHLAQQYSTPLFSSIISKSYREYHNNTLQIAIYNWLFQGFADIKSDESVTDSVGQVTVAYMKNAFPKIPSSLFDFFLT